MVDIDEFSVEDVAELLAAAKKARYCLSRAHWYGRNGLMVNATTGQKALEMLKEALKKW